MDDFGPGSRALVHDVPVDVFDRLYPPAQEESRQ
jgi:hypothetical protein